MLVKVNKEGSKGTCLCVAFFRGHAIKPFNVVLLFAKNDKKYAMPLQCNGVKLCKCAIPMKKVELYWLARMGQNFDQAKRDGTF